MITRSVLIRFSNIKTKHIPWTTLNSHKARSKQFNSINSTTTPQRHLQSWSKHPNFSQNPAPEQPSEAYLSILLWLWNVNTSICYSQIILTPILLIHRDYCLQNFANDHSILTRKFQIKLAHCFALKLLNRIWLFFLSTYFSAWS